MTWRAGNAAEGCEKRVRATQRCIQLFRRVSQALLLEALLAAGRSAACSPLLAVAAPKPASRPVHHAQRKLKLRNKNA